MIDEQTTTDEKQVSEPEKEPVEHTAIMPEIKPDEAMTIGTGADTTMTTHSVSFVPTPEAPTSKNTVTILINYPKDYQGRKVFKDGQKREVSEESAKMFVKKGFAKIIKEK